MKMNPQSLTTLVKQGSSNLVATSRNFFRRFDPGTPQDATNVETYDESILQQGRFWMRTVTWTLIGTTVFGVGWLALALFGLARMAGLPGLPGLAKLAKMARPTAADSFASKFSSALPSSP